MDRRAFIKLTGLAAAAYFAAYMLSLIGAYIISGAVLIAAGVFIGFTILKKSSKLLEPAAYFSVSWIGGCGVSALKLSHLQTDWANETWICFFLAYLSFMIGYALLKNGKVSPDKGPVRAENDGKYIRCYSDGLMTAIDIVMLLSIAAFITEAYILGYVPLFTTDTPHAYSYFHVSGLHYFTVSCVLIPSLSVMWYRQRRALGLMMSSSEWLRYLNVGLCTAAAVLLPIFLVSRFQLVFSVLLAGMTYICINGGVLPFRINVRAIMLAAAGFLMLILLYVFITYERAHSIDYLNGIFEMKYDLPIFISQPYIYIANNFDNFNCLVEALTEHTLGLRLLFPFFALTGMKFTHPELVAFPIYVTKEELTTVTLLYDAYYDFGVMGTAVFSFVIGAVMACIGRYTESHGEDAMIVRFIYAQLNFYLLFAFFTTWFSNPTTWFYIIASAAIGIFIKMYTLLMHKRTDTVREA